LVEELSGLVLGGLVGAFLGCAKLNWVSTQRLKMAQREVFVLLIQSRGWERREQKGRAGILIFKAMFA